MIKMVKFRLHFTTVGPVVAKVLAKIFFGISLYISGVIERNRLNLHT